MPVLSALVPIQSGLVSKFRLLVLGQVIRKLIQFCIYLLIYYKKVTHVLKTVWILKPADLDLHCFQRVYIWFHTGLKKSLYMKQHSETKLLVFGDKDTFLWTSTLWPYILVHGQVSNFAIPTHI